MICALHQVFPGKAYVRGFDIEKPGVEIIDVENQEPCEK